MLGWRKDSMLFTGSQGSRSRPARESRPAAAFVRCGARSTGFQPVCLSWPPSARGCPCPVAGRSLRASCPALARCCSRFRHPGFARPATPAPGARAAPRSPDVAQVFNLCAFLGHLPRGAAHARRRTLAMGILPCARSMLLSLRHPGFARPATPAPGARAAPRSPDVAQVFNLCTTAVHHARGFLTQRGFAALPHRGLWS